MSLSLPHSDISYDDDISANVLTIKFTGLSEGKGRNNCLQILLSNSQAGPGRKVKQEQEEISRNHVQAFIPGSVEITAALLHDFFFP